MAVATACVVAASAVGAGALGDQDRTSVTTATPTPAPSASPTSATSASASPSSSPSPTRSLVTKSSYRRPLPGELPRAIVREAGGENTWPKADEGQQIGIGAQVATFTRGVRPERIEPTTVEIGFGSVWVPASDGVVRVDPKTLQPVDFVPLGGRVMALATSGYSSMYAVHEGPGRSLTVASWEAVDGTAREVHSFVLDSTPGSADTVRGDAAVDAFAELVYLVRTYGDRPGELVAVSVINGSHEVLATMGGPGSALVVARAPGDGETHLWVGGSPGQLWHVHPDGRITGADMRGAIEDIEVSGDRVWLTVGRTESRPVLVDARTEGILMDERGVVARHVAIEDERFRTWSSSGGRHRGGVQIAMLSNDSGRPFTTAAIDVAAIHDLALGGDSTVFGISPASGELIRLEADFGE